jgi:hypothetical protein
VGKVWSHRGKSIHSVKFEKNREDLVRATLWVYLGQ